MHRISPRPLPKLAPPATLWRRLRAWSRGTFRKLEAKRPPRVTIFAPLRWSDRDWDEYVASRLPRDP